MHGRTVGELKRRITDAWTYSSRGLHEDKDH